MSNKRTNSQITHVQKLIMDLIDIYWQEEREKEKQRLEAEARARLAEHPWGEEEDEGPDLYPFSLRHNRYGEFLEFVADESELNLPGDDDLDDVEVLNEIIEWFADNESVEGFVDAKPSEYFAALALLLVEEAVFFIPANGEKMDTTVNLKEVKCFVQPAMKSMKAICYAREAESRVAHELALQASEERIAALTVEVASLADSTAIYKMEKKASTQKANVARHVKNREAAQLVTKEWEANSQNFRSTAAGAKHYKLWLEGLGFYYEITTVCRWLQLSDNRNKTKKS